MWFFEKKNGSASASPPDAVVAAGGLQRMVRNRVVGDVAVAEVAANAILSPEEGKRLQDELYEVADARPPRLLVDLGRTGALSSLCLGVVREVARRIRANGGSFAVCGLQPEASRLLALFSREPVEAYADQREALKVLQEKGPADGWPRCGLALVLVADTDADCHDRLRAKLHAAGMCMLAARDRYALTVSLVDQRPDALVLAMDFGESTGLEIAEAIKSRERFRTIPVVLLTSSPSEAERRRALDLGVSAYVVKRRSYERGCVRSLMALLGRRSQWCRRGEVRSRSMMTTNGRDAQ